MRDHQDELDERLAELERNPFTEVTAADHTDDHPDPDPVNGHIPDYRAETALGEEIIGEVEHADDSSSHTESQFEAFATEARDSPSTTFELATFEDDGDDEQFSLF